MHLLLSDFLLRKSLLLRTTLHYHPWHLISISILRLHLRVEVHLHVHMHGVNVVPVGNGKDRLSSAWYGLPLLGVSE